MSHVIFVNPPSPFLITDRGSPPLGILQLAAILREQGLAKVSVWDMTGDEALAHQFGGSGVECVHRFTNLPRWVEDLSDNTVFGITATSAQYHAAQNLLLRLKWHNPHWRVIIGGPHVSALPDEALMDGFDAVFAGEADEALPRWLNAGEPPGVYRCVAPRDLDRLPAPARDLVDLTSYCANLTVGQGLSSTVALSRGCPFRCAYCVRTLGDAARLLRERSVGYVLEEVHQLDLHYGIRRFVAVDDLWGVKRGWVEAFCDVFAGEPYHWRVNCRANVLHDDLLPRMKEVGVDVISFGFESGSDRVLSAISKNSVDLNTQAVQACHDAGIAVKAYLIFGFAEDDAASVEATKRWIEAARPDSAQVAWLIPLPGTPIYQQAVEQGWQPAYDQLYHNGQHHRGGMARLPWHTDETAGLYEDLCQWTEDCYQQPQPVIECPVAISNEVI